MSTSIAVVTSQENVGKNDVLEIVRSLGGHQSVRCSELGDPETESLVTICLDKSILPGIVETYPEGITEIAQALGGEPKTSIVADFFGVRGAELALRFACACATLWPCVVYTLMEEFRILTKEDLLKLREEETISFD